MFWNNLRVGELVFPTKIGNHISILRVNIENGGTEKLIFRLAQRRKQDKFICFRRGNEKLLRVIWRRKGSKLPNQGIIDVRIEKELIEDQAATFAYKHGSKSTISNACLATNESSYKASVVWYAISKFSDCIRIWASFSLGKRRPSVCFCRCSFRFVYEDVPVFRMNSWRAE
jgi:hypothetical protein